MEEIAKLPLPEAFLDFLEANGLDPSIYTAIDTTPRYIRLKPGSEAEIEEIKTEINCNLERVNWLASFYSLPHHVHIANSRAYREGKIYGIDAASGAAVLALNISVGDHVLDLCAAPGAKLCMISELLGDSGSVTGVDISRDRLAACRTMLQKYNLGDRCRLFVADGTAFSLLPVREHSNLRSCESASQEKEDTYRKWTSRRPYKERKRASKARERAASALVAESDYPELIFYGQDSGVIGLSKSELYQIVCGNELSNCGYDKVLVDAECTHDGSIRHIQKFEHWGWETLYQRVLQAERSDSLTSLQLKLLTNGFKLLRVGGLVVYSTCSLTVSQNEDVVQQFLKENPSAGREIDTAQNWPCKSGRIQKTLRFDSVTSQTSGLFVARFIKLAT
ncbi:conserved hypothetical protein [Ricinus communis]|uniref:SAM-dependent MTase RsmB/NOP-type domain-containing protein n=1 Tax=Ricinus communis TaxID=3988 RepID=B9SUI2_RICCO|nr:conserved hypothetical protein [Ricinus communis]